VPELWLRAAASKGRGNVTDLRIASRSLNSRITNKASVLLLCLFGPDGRVVKVFAPLRLAFGQRCHNIKLLVTFKLSFFY
jgi:hypothetical protein